jgi:16S rRNA A1518/A1519 N6-dimethyltransferase RsmA/KsgA/DIM1 with predicted DNA glycosylase/AP lyase activity
MVLVFNLILLVFLLILIIISSIQLFNLIFRGYAPFISTNNKVLEKIVEEVKLDKNSVFFELGAGRAGILRALEKKFKEGDLVGIEYAFFPYFLASLQLIFNRSRVIIIKKDLFKMNLSKADYLYCFLSKKMMARLEKKVLEENKKGTIIISYIFTFPNLKPYKIIDINKNKVYFYKA